jgi:hypothetical protein
MTDPLLDYRVATSPSPLEASSATTPSSNRITIAVFHPGDTPVHCDAIQLSVPKNDPHGNPYFSQRPDFSCSRADWEVDSKGLEAETQQYYRVTFKPTDPGNYLIDYPLDFGITGILGPTTGTLTCLLREHSSTDASGFTYKEATLTMAVVAQTFYLDNFLARDPGRPTIPRTKFSAGDRIEVVWESNGTYFQLFGGDGTVLHQGKDTHFVLESGIRNDTTLTLAATLTSGPAQSENGFEPIYQYATLTVTVTDPTLAALTVTGGADVRGSLSVGNGLTVKGLLDAQNDLVVSGGGWEKIATNRSDYLTVYGSALIEQTLKAGDLTVDEYGGKLTTVGIAGLKVGGQLTVAGQLAAQSDCEVNGLLQAKGDFTAGWGGTEKITTRYQSGLTVKGPLEVDGSMRRAGQDAVCNGSTIGLKNNYRSTWMYASEMYWEGEDRRFVFTWDPGNRTSESYWEVNFDNY